MVLLLLLLPKALHAQFDTASVLGTVRDSSGATVPGAYVSLLNVNKGVTLRQKTTSSGTYEYLEVAPGTYRITVDASGFQKITTEAFSVDVAARQRVDVKLSVGSITQNVIVSGAASLLQTDTSDRGETISGAVAVALPLNGRAYADLSVLVPGVRKSLLESNAFPSRDASYNVNGLSSMDNNFLLDGIDNNAYQEANQGYSNEAIVPAPDAIQEFKVITDNFPAEYGRAGGAIINATIRGGTNAFHGVVYEYLRNTALNAYGPFIGLGVKPTLVQNQFGGTFGGPILKNKLFFFTDYEGLRSNAHVLTEAELPTPAEDIGLFTKDGSTNDDPDNAVPVKNPYTGVVYTNGQVPLTDPNIDPMAVYVLSHLPAPNIPGAALTADNFQYMAPNTNTDDQGDGKVDFILNPRQAGFFRYSQRAVTWYTGPPFPGIVGGDSNGTQDAYTRQIAAGFNWSPKTTSILELRFGETWTQSGKTGVNQNQPNLLTQFNIPNAPSDPSYTGGLNAQSVTGYTQFGEMASTPQFTNPTDANAKVDYSFIHGPHTIKVGYEYGWLSEAIDDFNPMFGEDKYAGEFSATTGTSQQAANLTDFLFGARNNYQLNNHEVVNYLRFWHMPYIQDDWRVRPNLTINAGLRYDFVSPNYEQNNQMENYDPVHNRLLHAGNGTDVISSAYTMHYVGCCSLAQRGLVNPDFKDFAPRLGFAYQIHRGMVLSAAYGISYAFLFRFGDEGVIAYNGPDIVDAEITQVTSEPLCTSVTENPSTCFRRTQDGYETNFASAENFATTEAETRYQPADFKTPYIQSYQASLQQLLPFRSTLEVSYAGNHGVHIPAYADYNQARLCTEAEVESNSCPSLLSRRPISGFTDILDDTNYGFLIYNSLQTEVEHRFHGGVYLSNAFTWSKSTNNSAAEGEALNGTGDSALVNIRNVRGDRGVGSYDQPFNDTLAIIVELPFGRGSRFGGGASAWKQRFISGWELTAINQETSGLPINLTYTPATKYEVSTTDIAYGVRPNLVSTPRAVYGKKLTKTSSSLSDYLNSSEVSIPPGYQLFGDAGRNILRGPSYGDVDLAIHKTFALWGEHRTLQFRIEAFNALNATNYALPNSSVSAGASFGAFTSSQSSVYPSRQVQLALRLAF